jgi:hypothetical protein
VVGLGVKISINMILFMIDLVGEGSIELLGD